ncbi:MAG TPA: ABC transporter permease subunit [Rhizomicrobium sp.]
MQFLPTISVKASRYLPSRWDLLAALIVLTFIVAFASASRLLMQPLSSLQTHHISLSPSHLPGYALRTALRMLIAMGLSLLFTFTYATLAAKRPRAGALLVPLLDILQSVPILGFISITVVFFLSLAPGRIFGAELAAVFAIFTSQAWNMAFSFYQSLRTVPEELEEAGRMFRLNAWARFWRIEVPFAMPQLVWNMMMSMSGGWFFVVAAEAITVGHTTLVLPGIGSYIATAIAQRSLPAIFWAIGAMLIVILIYDQLLFRPLVAWADRFRFDEQQSEEQPDSWALTMFRRSRLIAVIAEPFSGMMRRTFRSSPDAASRWMLPRPHVPERTADVIWNAVLIAIAIFSLWWIGRFAQHGVSLKDIRRAFESGLITMVRVLVLIALASAVWVPVGVYVGLRPRLAGIVQPVAQFLAAFPANLLFPLAVSAIVIWDLNPDIWLSPLMVLGTQWYILFNVIAGASTLPMELRDAATNFNVRGWLWWRNVALPGVFPFYITGAITASGGSWNASIVAEVASWGGRTLHAHGLGAYIADATAAGNFHRIVLGIAVMSFLVTLINRLFWRRLYVYAERRFRVA